MEGVFLILVLFFYLLVRMLFWLRPDERRKDRKRLAPVLELLACRQFAEALPLLDAHLAQHPRSVEGLLARARCHFEEKEFLLCVADNCKAINQDSHLPQAYLLKGKAFFAMGHLDEALVEFDRAAWYDRENPEPYTWRGLVHRQMGQEGKAYADLQTALRMGDENASFYLRTAAYSGSWR